MAYRKILSWPNKKLKQVSDPIQVFDNDSLDLAQDLYDTLKVKQGAGLAAPQIGVLKRMVIIKCSYFGFENPDPSPFGSDILVLINPLIELSGKEVTWTEACLSVPFVTGDVPRYDTAAVQYQNLNGEHKELIAPWPMSGAVQHECDHLDGIVFLDQVNTKYAVELKRKIHYMRRLKIKRNKKIKKLQEEPKEVIDTRMTHGPGKRKKKKRKK